jgi:3-dehydroquinate dehydratase-2
MSHKVLIINGPNLNRLGTREPEIYGSLSYADLERTVEEKAVEIGLIVELRQSNSESEIIGWLQEAANSQLPVIMNPAAFTHYSYAIADACAMLVAPLIEVHISNPGAREEFRHHSVVTPAATGVIAGFGLDSYLLALQAMSRLLLAKA